MKVWMAFTRDWFPCGWDRFHIPWWSLHALRRQLSCCTGMLLAYVQLVCVTDQVYCLPFTILIFPFIDCNILNLSTFCSTTFTSAVHVYIKYYMPCHIWREWGCNCWSQPFKDTPDMLWFAEFEYLCTVDLDRIKCPIFSVSPLK